MKTYLILSPAYYGGKEKSEWANKVEQENKEWSYNTWQTNKYQNNEYQKSKWQNETLLANKIAKNKISVKLQTICDKLKAKNMQLDFAAFRYDNSGMLNVYEYYMLLEFIGFCRKAKIIPLLNLSHYKLEVLLLLWLHGFQIGVHFKESDMPILRNNISESLFMVLSRICTLQNNFNSSLMDFNLVNSGLDYKLAYNLAERLAAFSTLHSCQTIAKIVDKLIADKNYFQSLTAPLQHAISIFNADNTQIMQDDFQKFCIFVSTHNVTDLAEMLECGINYATISPIFYDKGNKALGLNYLREMPDNLRAISFALGGITSDLQVERIASLGLFGFASISYFLNL